ncbi:MAG: MBL fold metallo-hydrolase [Planctomycetota bacterium]|jgi:Cft2 family RNA processing exonuclease
MDLFEGGVRVDHFTRGAELYFLTHYHSDHMAGLRAGWRNGTIGCSEDTASLLAVGKEIPRDRLLPLPLEVPERFELADDVLTVTAFDANHCPGATMFLLEGKGHRTLVTGDFRLDDAMRERLPRFAGIDTLYVDVTYDHPRYDTKKELIVVETYTVGKNKVLQGLFDAFGEPFFLDPNRLRLYRSIGYGDLVTGDLEATRFFACGSRYLDRSLASKMGNWRKRAVVISPTGWAVDGRTRGGAVGFPYTEHCSWPELCEFVRAVRPGKIVVTEGGKTTKKRLHLP